MEVYQDIRSIDGFGNRMYQEIKPMKGIDFDQEVQRFEQAYKAKGLDAIENLDSDNIISNFDNVLFNKVGEFKISINNKLDEMHRLFNSEGELSQKDLLKAQYQVGMFTVEVTVVSNGSDKVSDGIITLFQMR